MPVLLKFLRRHFRCLVTTEPFFQASALFLFQMVSGGDFVVYDHLVHGKGIGRLEGRYQSEAEGNEWRWSVCPLIPWSDYQILTQFWGTF